MMILSFNGSSDTTSRIRSMRIPATRRRPQIDTAPAIASVICFRSYGARNTASPHRLLHSTICEPDGRMRQKVASQLQIVYLHFDHIYIDLNKVSSSSAPFVENNFLFFCT
jgi:hypothetical protein